jgi:hypothetical protein
MHLLIMNTCRLHIVLARNGLHITDYKIMAPRGAPVNRANLGSMGFKLSTKLIIIR